MSSKQEVYNGLLSSCFALGRNFGQAALVVGTAAARLATAPHDAAKELASVARTTEQLATEVKALARSAREFADSRIEVVKDMPKGPAQKPSN